VPAPFLSGLFFPLILFSYFLFGQHLTAGYNIFGGTNLEISSKNKFKVDGE
jgi:hypothetical protein